MMIWRQPKELRDLEKPAGGAKGNWTVPDSHIYCPFSVDED